MLPVLTAVFGKVHAGYAACEILLEPRPLGLLVSQYGDAVTVMWASLRFGHTHIQNPSDMGIP